MTLLPSSAFKSIIQSLLLNAYTVEPAGFAHGKAGIALTLFELSRFCNSDTIENHAFDILQESLAYDISEYKFANGTSGIAYTILHLIKNKFLDADYINLYGNQHQDIITKIKATKYKKQNGYNYISDLFFIYSFTEYISDKDYIMCTKILTDNIVKTLDNFYKETDLQQAINFHKYAAILLVMCNSIHASNITSDEFFYKIKKIQNKLGKQDCICDFPLFPIQLYICGKYKDKQNIQQESKQLLETSMNNIIVPALNYRQKTDLVFNIYRLYALDNSLNYRHIADSIINTIVDNDTIQFEKKIYKSIINNSTFSMGIGAGISRLILLNIYWSQIQQGCFPNCITELLN